MTLTIICIITFICLDIGILYKVKTYDQDRPRHEDVVIFDPEWLLR